MSIFYRRLSKKQPVKRSTMQLKTCKKDIKTTVIILDISDNQKGKSICVKIGKKDKTLFLGRSTSFDSFPT